MIYFVIGFIVGALFAFAAAAVITWWSERDPIAYVNEDTEQ